MFKRLFSTRRAALWLMGLTLTLGVVTATPAQPAATPAVAPPVAVAPAQPASAIVAPTGDLAATNPYGLKSVWSKGDLVARGTLLLLAVMSLLSWYLIVAKLLEQRKLDAQARAARKTFASADAVQRRGEGLDKGSPFRAMMDSALEAARRYYSLSSQVDMADWLSQDIVRSVGNLQMRAQEGLSVLATVGATAPFVGLFGTVWGIYNALVTIGVSGQASIDRVAGPVGEALIMTALGLAVAVPAVLGYNWLVRRNRVTLHLVKALGSELHTQLLVEIDKSQRAGQSALRPA